MHRINSQYPLSRCHGGQEHGIIRIRNPGAPFGWQYGHQLRRQQFELAPVVVSVATLCAFDLLFDIMQIPRRCC